MANIILTGFMGCGKSSIGIHLSYRLRQAVLDTDKKIARDQGMPIQEIFEKYGEEGFRRMEYELLEKLKREARNLIISTGGGLPLREENRRLLKEIGTVVYLRAKPETIYMRVKKDTARPLLRCEDRFGKICELLKERSPLYEAGADVIVDVDGKDFRQIVNEIQMAAGRNRQRENVLPGERYVPKERGVSRERCAPETVQKADAGAERVCSAVSSKKKLLVINGPNLNFLGIREKDIYGTKDYNCLLNMIAGKAEQEACEIQVFQSNHEGAIIDRIQEAYFDGTDGIIINPGAYTHYSYAIHDALASVTMPKVEIHISDITKREAFRSVSVTAPACDKQIYGQGLEGYLQAVDFVLSALSTEKSILF